MNKNLYFFHNEIGPDLASFMVLFIFLGTCINNHKSDKDCNTWADHGHCKINSWMLKHCAKSCKSCKSTEEKTTTTASPDNKALTTKSTTDKSGNFVQRPMCVCV